MHGALVETTVAVSVAMQWCALVEIAVAASVAIQWLAVAHKTNDRCFFTQF